MNGSHSTVRALFVVLIMAFLALCGCPAHLAAAEGIERSPAAATLPDDLSPAEVDEAMSTMDDEQARQLLHERLKAQAEARAAQDAPESRSNRLMDASTQLRERLLAIKASRGHILDELGDSLQRMAQGGGYGALLLACVGALLITFAAWAMETLFRRRMTGWRNRTRISEESSSKGRMLAADAFLAVSGLLLYAVTILALFSAFFGKETPGYVVAAHILLFFLVFRPVQVVARLLLRPNTPELRIIPLSDKGALALNSFIGTLMLLALGSWYTIEAFRAVGTSETAVIVLQLALACVMLGFVLLAIFSFRKSVAEAIACRRNEESVGARLRAQFASRWHIIAILYVSLVAIIYLAVLLTQGIDGPHGLFLMSLGVIPLYYLLDLIAKRILDGVFGIIVAKPPKPMSMVHPVDEGGCAPEAASTESAEVRQPVSPVEEQPRPESHPLYETTRRSVRIALAGFVALILLHAWRVPVPRADLIIEAGVNILVILFITVGLWRLIKRAIERKFREASEAGNPNPRLRTLLPLFQKILGVFFLVTASLMVIAQFGVDIGPLLAGAGVLGLAIGLGSQTLVKDVVAGVFFLMDDAFRVGDYVKLGSTEGYVIRMSVRTLNLEHYLGYVLIIPYGDIKNVINFSRNPISIKLKIPMPLETDPKKFKKIVRKINDQLMEEEEFRGDLVQPVKSQGVKRIEDSVMTFGVKFMARPGTQFSIRKEVYARLYKELKKAGLTFAAPGVTVYTAKQDAEDAETATQGAAAAAVQKRKAAKQQEEGAKE
ncbi:hypothetical protein DPQ33_06985 [Oceanidesulfovibrio indonesiensis]|uniref:Mechanosensitive ion channel family protein n=1 Tax=Oceanidesulfovibrio indonesiensis TaxID=54767 RepID=A0A7M3MFN2_9BACT|nr:mechanosensitive ion channel family protein [Oceanidesulfovibrio indonesiensis]TVM17851.1 hypothetical protein DPQ33_06985 [Oceanidesulfovibrio indonesiensis]